MSTAFETEAEVAVLDRRVSDLRNEVGKLESRRREFVREPLTYEARLVPDGRSPFGLRAVSMRGDDYSYVKDITNAELMTGDYVTAQKRLERHAREMTDIARRKTSLFSHEVSVEFERRAVSWTSGAGGYFAPPLWLIEFFAIVPTPERVLAAMAPQFDLPIGAQSVNLPRWTAGAEDGSQQVDAPAVVTDLQDQAVSSAVATIAGNADVPMQMLEQSPVGAHLDWAVFTNMEARYGYQLELQMLNGTGVASPQGSGNNQLLGLLQNSAVPSSNKITYNDASPTVTKMLQTGGQGGPLPQAIAAIGNNRKVKPQAWMMTTSRGAWITSGEISFPLALANQVGSGAFDLLAYPVAQNDAIPTNLGDGKQDTVIACRPSDWLLLESERRTNVFSEVISGQLMARLQMRRYAAALLRQPTSVSYLQGTGMDVQTGF